MRALALGFGQRGQQHCGENGDDGNDDQKFNQCETWRFFHILPL